MTWRNQLRDLAILYSVSDDLKLFWQLKAVRWEKLETKVRQVAEQTSGFGIADENEVASKFKQLLLGDADYREVRHRIRTEIKEVIAITKFLGLELPVEIEEITFDPPLMSNEIIEDAVDALDRLIVLCRVSSYPYHYFWQAIRSPQQFITSCWEFYFG